jgi:large subunit ribosomal protein L24
MAKLKIKKGDKVEIIAGDDKGKSGVVKAVFPKDSKVIVEGCKLIKKAVKPNDERPNGGFDTKEAPIHVSNVRLAEGA